MWKNCIARCWFNFPPTTVLFPSRIASYNICNQCIRPILPIESETQCTRGNAEGKVTMVKRTGGADRFSGCLQIEFTSRRSRNESNRVRTCLGRVILWSVNDAATMPQISERIRFPLINDRFLPSAVRSLQDAAAGHEGVHVVHVDQILQSQQRPSFVFVRRWETRR